MEFIVRCFVLGEGTDPESVRRKLIGDVAGTLLQTVKDGLFKNEKTVELLVAQTYAAKGRKQMLAKSEEVDLLLRVAGTTQILEAISAVGAVRGAPFLMIIAGRKDNVLRVAREMENIGTRLEQGPLTEEELMVVEEAALLNISKG